MENLQTCIQVGKRDKLDTLKVDSAACENIYGITSKALSSTFKTRSDDYYGTINLSMTEVEETFWFSCLKIQTKRH